MQTIAVSPSLKVLDGHQRLSALLTLHGKDYEVDARQSDRELSDVEQRALVLTLHAGATGQWNWDELSNWDATFLQDFGLDEDYFKQLQTDTAALLNLTASELEPTDPANDPFAEWEGMPEFEQERLSDNKIVVYFPDDNARLMFGDLLGQLVNINTKFIWFPKDSKPQRQGVGVLEVETSD